METREIVVRYGEAEIATTEDIATTEMEPCICPDWVTIFNLEDGPYTVCLGEGDYILEEVDVDSITQEWVSESRMFVLEARGRTEDRCGPFASGLQEHLMTLACVSPYVITLAGGMRVLLFEVYEHVGDLFLQEKRIRFGFKSPDGSWVPPTIYP